MKKYITLLAFLCFLTLGIEQAFAQCPTPPICNTGECMTSDGKNLSCIPTGGGGSLPNCAEGETIVYEKTGGTVVDPIIEPVCKPGSGVFSSCTVVSDMMSGQNFVEIHTGLWYSYAECAVDEVLTGGGCSLSQSSLSGSADNFIIREAFPEGSRYYCTVSGGMIISHTAYAICCK